MNKLLEKLSMLSVLGLVVLVGTVFGLAGHFYLGSRAPEQDSPQQATKESDDLVAKVGKLMVLPDEKPEIATVTDPDALKSDPFFQSAKIGDKLLIFSKARRAILFDPVAGVILNAAPLNVAPSPTPSATK